MKDIRERIFLVTGADFFQRKLACEKIKQKISLNSPHPLSLSIFYSKEIEPRALEEALLTVSFDKNKIVIFKDAHNLSSEAKDFLLKNLRNTLGHLYIILETDKDFTQLHMDKKLKDCNFFSFIFKNATVYKFAFREGEVSLEDLKRCIRRSDVPSALCIIEKLFDGRVRSETLGPQILGVLVSEFSYLKNPLEKEKSFRHLWELDRAIKERGIDYRLAIEVALIKLLVSG